MCKLSKYILFYDFIIVWDLIKCYRVSKFFIDKGIEELKTKNKSDDEKVVLEKLLEINEEYALIMASDMLFAGVDTVRNKKVK